MTNEETVLVSLARDVVFVEEEDSSLVVYAEQGPRGIPGIKGDKGDKGDAGTSASLSTDPNNLSVIGSDGGIYTPERNPVVTVKDEGTTLVSSLVAINFTGSGVSASNSAGTVTVNVPGLSGESYTHTQSIASDTWIIVHGLGSYPSVTIIDSSGDEVEGELKYVSSNEIHVTFSAMFGGTAYLN